MTFDDDRALLNSIASYDTQKALQQTNEMSERTTKLGEWTLELAKHLGTLTEQMLRMEARITELEKPRPGEWEQPNFVGDQRDMYPERIEPECSQVAPLCHCLGSTGATGLCDLPPNHSGAHKCGVCGMTWDAWNDPGVELTP